MPPENPQSSQNPSLRQIRTFQGDVADALGRQKESLVSIQQTESLRRRLDPGTITDIEAGERRKRNLLFLGGSLLLIGLGAVAGFYAYGEFLKKTAIPMVVAPENRFIVPTTELSIDTSGFNKEKLGAAFNTAVSGSATDELKHIVLKKGALKDSPLLKTDELFLMLNSQAPGNLVRAFDKSFMLGSWEESHFLILRFTSYENAFAGMLAWEKNMPQDIGSLFAIAPFLKSITPTSVFNDMTVKNKDVRILEVSEDSSTASLLYTFYDNDTLIITDSIRSLQTIIDRLTREKLSR